MTQAEALDLQGMSISSTSLTPRAKQHCSDASAPRRTSSSAKQPVSHRQEIQMQSFPINGHGIKAGDSQPLPNALATVRRTGLWCPRPGLSADPHEHRLRIGVLDTVAHELRNALMPIRLAAAQLGAVHGDESRLPRLRVTIEQQLDLMSRLIGDLVDNARAGNGKLRLQCTDTDVADVLARTIAACRPGMVAREQHLVLDIPATPALRCYGDPLRLVQILGNLLDNASKYTPCGGRITLSVRQNNERIAMTVSDNGIGIAAAGLVHIFEPFVQTDEAVRFNDSGLGIGLSLVRNLVEAHGGRVVARSAGIGFGSQFTVTLPIGSSAKPRRRGHPAKSS
ncbi:sensor histidine kinase [Paucibacter sp. PLA-PC-4]|uniref:sensor histidine kinase n=1 Tax=Paucibacter sp. PLA-PC-4 TaxID=2993655 RepID=UPI0022499FFC|nr:HAMP domain-containing sensor histidine kinase [Paucibacter sp. PLA-PC-4]